MWSHLPLTLRALADPLDSRVVAYNYLIPPAIPIPFYYILHTSRYNYLSLVARLESDP
jgi:hypothetical protein